jgi:hypothetical protein
VVQREKEIDQLCEQAVGVAVKAVELAFEQGDDLMEAKAICKHGDWELWVEANFVKGNWTARRYMSLAAMPKTLRQQCLLTCKSMTSVYKLLGILPPEPENQIENGGSITIPPVIQRLTWIAEWTGRNLDEVAAWEQPRRDELKIKLKPIVELYEKL